MRLILLFLFFSGLLNSQTPFKAVLFPSPSPELLRTPSPMKRVSGLGHVDQQKGISSKAFMPLQYVSGPAGPKRTPLSDPKRDEFSIWAQGNQKVRLNLRSVNSSIFTFLAQFKSILNVAHIAEEFVFQSMEKDDLNMQHIRLQQVYHHLPVHGGELILHGSGDMMTLVNGRAYPTPVNLNLNPGVTNAGATTIVLNDLISTNQFKPVSKRLLELLNRPLHTSELLIYHDELHKPHLAYSISYIANGLDIWNYMIDAHRGVVLNKYKNTCSFLPHEHKDHQTVNHAPVSNHINLLSNSFEFNHLTTTAIDLFGISVSLNTYEEPTALSLVDAGRPMFTSIGTDAIQPSGVIWTFDGFNTSPENASFNPGLIKGNAGKPWISTTAASAHNNAGLAYEYFRGKHGRNSINGLGGNILSIINVAESDGSSMDNAFWNGAAMFYGNGKDAFTSLAKSLDVAGHEMSHGVIQSTANLEYQGESGALNESFADIFGRLIDRNDWLIGEDVVKTSFFPSGALRSFIDPHNGGLRIGDAGFQPRIYSERYLGVQDNAGVHINSGIANWAFYQFVTRIGNDLDKAEKIYYRSLTSYLTRSSKFIDCRKAVIQAATDLYGATSAEVTAAKAAYDVVGILDGVSTITQTILASNTGSDFIVHTNKEASALYLSDAKGKLVDGAFNPLYLKSPLSKASITDDGTGIIFVGKDQKIHYVVVDWVNGIVREEGVLQEEAIWRNVAISRDGKRIAAVKAIQENKIHVFDFSIGLGGQWKEFELTNPTFTTGIKTSDVNFSDVIEFDHTGELLMYDAENRIKNSNGAQVVYWDISFLKVHDGEQNTWGDGKISKLFGRLPENTSVGNPTFSKNSPHIIAFDMLISSNNDSTYLLLGGNTETGKVDTIFVNSQQNIPSYSNLDDKIIFNTTTTEGMQVIGQVNLTSSKIKSTGDPVVLIQDAKLGTWFANGVRNISTATRVEEGRLYNVKISPNPVVRDDIQLSWVQPQTAIKNQISIYDLVGKLHWNTSKTFQPGDQSLLIPVEQLPAGIYIIQLNIEGKTKGIKFVRV